MKISSKAKQIELSLTRTIFNMAQEYDDVIDLTLGDPDVQPKEEIKIAACEAIMEGKTRYSANAGLLELREIICEAFWHEYGINANPKENVIVSVGGMEALYLCFSSLIDPKDEVIVFAPYYVNYVQMIKMCGGKPVIIYTTEKNGFMPTKVDIENAITEKTVAIVINSPGNPSGVMFEEDTLNEIALIAEKNDLVVISDEVYKTLLYDGKRNKSITSVANMWERTVVIDSISKRFAMTGYRLGYAIGPSEIIGNMIKMQENVCACAPLPSQYAAIKAYKEFLNDESLKLIFEGRRNYLVGAINQISGLKCKAPQGTFYLFVNIKGTGMTCVDFAVRLLKEEHVAVVPALAYGEAYGDYIRIAFTLEEAKLQEAIRRIKRFIGSFYSRGDA